LIRNPGRESDETRRQTNDGQRENVEDDVNSAELRINADRLREELDLEIDGGLATGADGAVRAALHERLESDLELARERQELLAVHSLLAAAVVKPRPGFAAEVMRSLPAAAWEGRTVSAWRWPFALLLVLGGVAAALFGGAAAELEPAAPGLAAFAALAKLFSSAALAGAGLAGATWQGLGLGLAQWLVSSKLHLLAGAILVAALNLLLFRLIRPTAREGATGGRTASTRSSRRPR
jgi:hypothetical protein